MATHKYTVAHNTLLTPSVRSVILTPAIGSRPLLFEPGQYIAVSLHDRFRPTTARCFSIASSPSKRMALEFSVRVGGAYTQALERLTPGAQVVVQGPFGSFTLKEHLYPRLVFFAGGIGITPFMSMIRYASELRLSNKIHLVFSCRNQHDIPFYEELTNLERHNPNFHVTYIIGEGDTERLRGSDVVMGRVNAQLLTVGDIGHASTTYMLCGPSGYLSSLQTLLAGRGVSRDRIITESFNQASAGESAQTRWPSNMYALGGLSLLVASLFVVSRDLDTTLPTLEAEYTEITTMVPDALMKNGTDGTTLATIEAIPPLVDTSITQEPIIKHIPNTDVVIKKVAAIPQQTPTPAPRVNVAPKTPTPEVVAPVVVKAPKPTPTVKPKARPKTKVS